MKTSLFEKLRQPETVVLSAGHDAGDPGTVIGNFKEADEAIILVDEIAKQLKKKGITVDVVPHESDLKTAIKYVNAGYNAGDAWAIEIHRCSADGLPVKQASLRCGVYYYPSQGSTEIGIFVANALKRFGADGTSWARPDTESGFTRLGWIRTQGRSPICSNSGAWRGITRRNTSSSWRKSQRSPYTKLSPALLGTRKPAESPSPESAPSSTGQLLRFQQFRW